MGAEQKGEDSRADGDPNTCTWSPDSAPQDPERTTFPDPDPVTRTVAPVDA